MNKNLPNTQMSAASSRAVAQRSIGTNLDRLAFASKLRMGNASHHDPKRASAMIVNANSQADMTKISQEQQLRIIDNQNAVELMPEIEWASRVLVSSILSPKDMTKRELTYVLNIGWLPPDIRQLICDKIREEMELNYAYSNSMYYIVKDALFTKGSHPRLVMPEAAVDKIINSGHTLSLESIQSSFAPDQARLKGGGYFGPLYKEGVKSTLTMESFAKAASGEYSKEPEGNLMFKDDGVIHQSDLITFTDNIDALKLPSYMEAIMENRRSESLNRPKVSAGDFDFAILSKEQTNENIGKVSGAYVDTAIGPPDNTPGGTNYLYLKPGEKSKNSGLTESQFRSTVYKAAPTNIVTHLRVPGAANLSRRSVGRPLVQSYPPEAVIPVHAPSDPKRHLGYLLIFDEAGHPITLAGSEQVMARAATLFNAANTSSAVSGDNMGSLILAKAARNLGSNSKATKMQEINKIFDQIIDENVIGRMMNGAYPGGASIGDSGDLYSLMLSRMLCSMRTRVAFVPAEMMSYFAFDFHDNGVGRSLLDQNKMLIGMRAGLLLTRVTGEMRNAIPLTEVLVKIDEDDPDPEKTIDQVLQTISQTRQPQYPLTTLAVNDIMDWVHRAGFVLKFAEHPRLPSTGFEFTKTHHENPLPDEAFYDRLGKQLYMGFGIPPELMDTTYDPDFAIAVANRNIIFTQTVLEYQRILSGLMSDDVQRLTLSDGVLLESITSIVKSKWGAIASSIPAEEKKQFDNNPKGYAESLIVRVIEALQVSVPSPDGTTLENQITHFDQYEGFIDKALKYIVSEDVISADYGKELVGKIATMQPAIKAAYMRDFMAKNNMLPELADVSSLTEDGKPAFDLLMITENHLKGLVINLLEFAKQIIPLDNAVLADSAKMNLGDEGASGSSGSLDSSGDSGGFGDDFSGFEDNLDETSLEETPEETAEEETSPEEDNKEEPPAS